MVALEEKEEKARHSVKLKAYKKRLKVLTTKVRSLKLKAKKKITLMRYNKRLNKYSHEVTSCLRWIRHYLVLIHQTKTAREAYRKQHKKDLREVRKETKRMAKGFGRPTI